MKKINKLIISIIIVFVIMFLVIVILKKFNIISFDKSSYTEKVIQNNEIEIIDKKNKEIYSEYIDVQTQTSVINCKPENCIAYKEKFYTIKLKMPNIYNSIHEKLYNVYQYCFDNDKKIYCSFLAEMSVYDFKTSSNFAEMISAIDKGELKENDKLVEGKTKNDYKYAYYIKRNCSPYSDYSSDEIMCITSYVKIDDNTVCKLIYSIDEEKYQKFIVENILDSIEIKCTSGYYQEINEDFICTDENNDDIYKLNFCFPYQFTKSIYGDLFFYYFEGASPVSKDLTGSYGLTDKTSINETEDNIIVKKGVNKNNYKYIYSMENDEYYGDTIKNIKIYFNVKDNKLFYINYQYPNCLLDKCNIEKIIDSFSICY